jgi:OPA family glycerol-3-phosphate transporter-like MFS transporter 1/2
MGNLKECLPNLIIPVSRLDGSGVLASDPFSYSDLSLSYPFYFYNDLTFVFISIHLFRWAFFVTFGGYMMAHFSRKSYSTIKTKLKDPDIGGFDPIVMATMDTVFMGTYAAGNIINGKLGDTFNPTTILSIGLFGSGACLFLLNFAIWFDLVNINAAIGNFFIIAVYFIFGFFQATGGPVGTAVMGNWYCDPESVKKRGTIFGFWTCHQYVGDIAAQIFTPIIFILGLPYWWALLVPALCNVGWGFLTLGLIADPYEADIITPEVKIRLANLEAKKKEAAESGVAVDESGPPPISYIDAFKIPMVAQYALAFGFFKLVNYTMFFNLPQILEENFSPATANLIAALYSVGMMPGGIIVGYVSDLLGGRRASVIGVFMLSLIVTIAVYANLEDPPAVVILPILGLMGILVGGYVHKSKKRVILLADFHLIFILFLSLKCFLL